jgi:hypothetical protein
MSLQARLARLERTRRRAGAWRGYEWPEKTADDLAREWAAVAYLGDTLGLLPFTVESPPPPAGGAGSITACSSTGFLLFPLLCLAADVSVGGGASIFVITSTSSTSCPALLVRCRAPSALRVTVPS